MVKPLPSYVLIEPIEDESKTSKGLYIPDSAKEKPSRGRVVSVGTFSAMGMDNFSLKDMNDWEGWMRYSVIPGEIEVGGTVVYKKWTNQEVTYDGKEYLLVGFSELLAVIK